MDCGHHGWPHYDRQRSGPGLNIPSPVSTSRPGPGPPQQASVALEVERRACLGRALLLTGTSGAPVMTSPFCRCCVESGSASRVEEGRGQRWLKTRFASFWGYENGERLGLGQHTGNRSTAHWATNWQRLGCTGVVRQPRRGRFAGLVNLSGSASSHPVRPRSESPKCRCWPGPGLPQEPEPVSSGGHTNGIFGRPGPAVQPGPARSGPWQRGPGRPAPGPAG